MGVGVKGIGGGRTLLAHDPSFKSKSAFHPTSLNFGRFARRSGQDFLIMRDLGANSVRTSHYPNDEIFLDLCDETGMLIWEQNHPRGLSEEAMRNSFP